MPTLWAHRNYFNNSSTAVAPTLAPSKGGYPLWQASNFSVGIGIGGILPLWEALCDWCSWFWTLFRRSLKYDRERRRAVIKTLNALEHPAFPLAQQSVRRTAVTLGFNRPEAWKELSRSLKSSPGHAENAFRHLEACRLTRANLISSTLTNPQANLIVELAYQCWAKGN